MVHEDLIDTIQRLLALSGSPNEHEARAALAMAQKLMLRHNLSMTDVEQAEVSQAGWIEEELWAGRRPGFEAEFAGQILVVYFFVRVYWQRRPAGFGRWQRAIRIFGRADQLLIARHVYVFISRTIRRLWAEQPRIVDPTTGRILRRTVADARAYALGVMHGLSASLDAERAEAARSAPDRNALVAVSNALEAAWDAAHPSMLPRTSADVSGDKTYYDRGLRDGRKITLHTPLAPSASATRLLESAQWA